MTRPRDPRSGDRRVDLSTAAILLTSIALATTGQLLLKAGMTEIGGLAVGELGELVRGALQTWQVLAGLVAFGASAVFWLITLSRLPLSTAYPVVSLSYLLILLFSVFVLGERPTAVVWLGALFIVTGISLIGVGTR